MMAVVLTSQAKPVVSSQPQSVATCDEGVRVVSSYIPAGEAKDLKWYFETGGADVYSTSPFEALCQRIRLFARPKRCPKCRGNGFMPLNPKRWRKTTEVERAQQKWLGKKPRYLVSARSRGVTLHDDLCRRCGGIGWIEGPQRARANKQVNVRTRCTRGRDRWGSVPLGTGGVQISDSDVVRLAGLERRLTIVRRREEVLFRALAAYYEPTGGKLRGLWEIVPAGRTLLRRNELELPPLMFFENVTRKQSETFDRQVGQLLMNADMQARELLERACRAWNMTALEDPK